MPHYDIMIIGHVTSDFLVYKGETSGFIGGGAYFSAFAARRSGVRIRVITKLAPKDFGILDGLKKDGIEVTALPSLRTTSIENVFETDDVDRRKVRLLSQADPFRPEDIPETGDQGLLPHGALRRGDPGFPDRPSRPERGYRPRSAGKTPLQRGRFVRLQRLARQGEIPAAGHVPEGGLSGIGGGHGDLRPGGGGRHPPSPGGQGGDGHPFLGGHPLRWERDVPGPLQSQTICRGEREEAIPVLSPMWPGD